MMRKLIIAFGYLLGGVVIIGGTFLLIAYGNGYSYDFKKGKLVHRGLVLLESTPSGAKITLGNKLLSQKTPYRQTFEGGEYDFTLNKDGYQTWHKRIAITPAEVSLIQYVILLPQKFQITTSVSHPSISQFTASRDRHRIAYLVSSGSDAGVWSFDTGNQNAQKIYGTPVAANGQPQEVDEIQGWSDDGSHVLIKATTGAQTAFLIVSNNPNDQVINVSSALNTNFTNLTFSKSTWRELYWQSPEGLRRVSVSDNTISDVIVAKYGAFTYAGDRLLYIDMSQPTASLWLVDHSGHKQQLVAALPPSTRYALGYATYINTPEVVVQATDTGTTMVYSDIFSSQVSSKSLSIPGNQVLFNGDGRFALIIDDHHVTTYDLEQAKTYTFPENNSTVTGLSWFDNYHVQFNRNGQIVMSEFDSNYATVLTDGSNLAPFNAQDNKTVFAVTAASNGSSQIKAVKIRQ